MATKTVKTQIGLRRDTEANYELVKDTLIPVKGEVCMVDTDKGLKFKIGDGTSTFAQLDFIEPNTSGAGGTNVEANPELTGNEEKLNSITIDGTNYDIPSGAEAYVEEHQTLVINNNGTGTGGSNNNNLFQRRLDQPSAGWNEVSSQNTYLEWYTDNASSMYRGQIVFLSIKDTDYYHGYCIINSLPDNQYHQLQFTPLTIYVSPDNEGIVHRITINTETNTLGVMTTNGYLEGVISDITAIRLY